MLGGTSPAPNFFINYPCTQEVPYLREFYVFKIAQCMFDFSYTIIFKYHRKDFPEFILHELIVLGLILFSLFSNFIANGAVGMMVCDFTDIFVSLCKFHMYWAPTFVGLLCFFMMFFSWMFFRLYYFFNFVFLTNYTAYMTIDNYAVRETGLFFVLFLGTI